MTFVSLVRFACATALLCVLMAADAVAGGPPNPYNPHGVVIIPEIPNTAESLVVRWDAGRCRHIAGDLLGISRTGNQIRIDIESTAIFGPPPGCTGFDRQEWTIGPYPAGTYELLVFGTSPITGDGETIALFSFTIVPGPPPLIPVNSPLALATLLLLISVIAAMVLSRSRQG